jgi:hypothetical protein
VTRMLKSDSIMKGDLSEIKIDEGQMSDRRNTRSSKFALVSPLTKFDFGN